MKRKIVNKLRKLGLLPILTKFNNIRLFIIKKSYISIGKNPLEAIYDNAFFKDLDDLDTKTDSSNKFAKYILEYYNPKSMIDIGCGTGSYLKAFEKRGVNIYGIEASKKALNYSKIDKNKIAIRDVSQDLKLSKKFDAVMCIEVAEHIPSKASGNLINNLTSLGKYIFFTAATPGQGGTDHINEKPREYWIKKFENMGFRYNAENTNKICDILRKKKVLFWIHQNLMVFEKNDWVKKTSNLSEKILVKNLT